MRGVQSLVALVALFTFLLLALPAAAHVCAYSSITVEENQVFPFVIFADVLEFQPSDYEIVTGMGGDPAIARVVQPAGPYSSLFFGIWWLIGDSPGTTNIRFFWNYSPTPAFANCDVAITVIADNGMRQNRANNLASIPVGDPLDAATGSSYLEEDVRMVVPGTPPIILSFSYDSNQDPLIFSRVGNNWMHNFDLSLLHDPIDNRATVGFEEGRILVFDEMSPGIWSLTEPRDEVFKMRETAPGVFRLFEGETQRRFDFDDQGLLAAIHDRNGNTLNLSYMDRRLEQVSNESGGSVDFFYSGLNNLTQLSDGTDTITLSHQFTGGAPNLVSMIDQLGQTTTYAYDFFAPLEGRMTSWTEPEFNTPFSNVFSGDQVVLQTDAFSNQTMISYGPGVTTVIDPLLQSTELHFSPQNALEAYQDPTGTTFTASYDADGHRTGIVSRTGNSSSFSYDPGTSELLSETGPTGSTTTLTYTPRSFDGFTVQDPTRVDLQNGSFETYTYDAAGNRLTRIDASGGLTTYTYDGAGRLLSETNPEGGQRLFSYDANGLLLTAADPATNTSIFGRDARHRVDLITLPDSNTVGLDWDGANQLSSITDPGNNTLTIGYDDNGNVTSLTNGMLPPFTIDFDDLNRPFRATDRNGHAREVSFDSLGRPSTVTNGNFETTSFSYDPRGFPDDVILPGGDVIDFQTDAEGNLTGFSLPRGHPVDFTLDGLGRPTELTRPLGWTEAFSYDPTFGLLDQRVGPAGEIYVFNYDAAGRFTGFDYPAGISTQVVNDGLDLATDVTDPRGQTWTTTRDDGGRPTAFSDPNGITTTYDYDTRNRVTQVTNPDVTEIIIYDANGNVQSQSFSPSGPTLAYTYDDQNRLTSGPEFSYVLDPEGQILDSNGVIMSYGPDGEILTITHEPGKTVSYSYDARGRLETVTDWTGAVVSYAYDANGNRISIVRPNAQNTTLGWDENDRQIFQSDGTFFSWDATRDVRGRIVHVDETVVTQDPLPFGFDVWTYDDASNLGPPLTNDARGNTTGDGIRTWTWDEAGNLVQTSDGVNPVDYVYDGLGNLISSTANGQTDSFLINHATSRPSIAQHSVDGVLVRDIVSEPNGAPISFVDPLNNHTFLHSDPFGDVILTTNDAGVPNGSADFSPFGTPGPANNVPGPFGFRGGLGAVTPPGSDLVFPGPNVFYSAKKGRALNRVRDGVGDTRLTGPHDLFGGNPNQTAGPPAFGLGVLPLLIPDTAAGFFEGLSPDDRARVAPVLGGWSDQAYSKLRRENKISDTLPGARFSSDPFLFGASLFSLNGSGVGSPIELISNPGTNPFADSDPLAGAVIPDLIIGFAERGELCPGGVSDSGDDIFFRHTRVPTHCGTNPGPLCGPDLDLDGFIPSDQDSEGFCAGDFNGDGRVNAIDLRRWKSSFFEVDTSGDLDRDGAVDFRDLGRLKTLFFEPPGPGGSR